MQCCPGLWRSTAVLFLLVGLGIWSCNQAEITPESAKTESNGSEALPEPFQAGNLWGYRNGNREEVIPARFVMAAPFHEEGGAVVVDDQGWGYIDQNGKVLLRPFVFDNGPDAFSDGLARFRDQGKIGFYAPSGAIVLPARFDFAWPFENGRAKVCEGCQEVPDGEHMTIQGGTYYFIDKRGNKIPEPSSAE